MNKSNIKIYGIFNFLFYIIVIIFNALANILPFNNVTTGELSDSYPNIFVPAGFTFAIWGLIYLLLGIFAVFQLIDSLNNKNHDLIGEIGIWFIVSSIANSAWILAWHFKHIYISMFLMLVILISLIVIYLKLDIGIRKMPMREKLIYYIPFSIYLGWITVATIANVTALLVHINWSGWGLSDQLWTIIMVVIAILITLFFTYKKNDIYHSIVVDWALFGILMKRLSLEWTSLIPLIIVVSSGIIIISFSILKKIFQKRVY